MSILPRGADATEGRRDVAARRRALRQERPYFESLPNHAPTYAPVQTTNGMSARTCAA